MLLVPCFLLHLATSHPSHWSWECLCEIQSEISLLHVTCLLFIQTSTWRPAWFIPEWRIHRMAQHWIREITSVLRKAKVHQTITGLQFIIKPNFPGTALTAAKLVHVFWPLPDKGSSKLTSQDTIRHVSSVLIFLQTNSLEIKYCNNPKPANLSFYFLWELEGFCHLSLFFVIISTETRSTFAIARKHNDSNIQARARQEHGGNPYLIFQSLDALCVFILLEDEAVRTG